MARTPGRGAVVIDQAKCILNSDIICGPGITAKSVTVEKGESFTFQTQRGRKYRGNANCTVEYKVGETCAKVSFICTKINIDNKDEEGCIEGDKLQVSGNGKSKLCVSYQNKLFITNF